MNKKLIEKIAQGYDADIYLFIGAMFPPDDRVFIESLRENKKHTNALLIIDTPGGSAEVAYRMGRAVQRVYKTKGASHEECGQFIFYVHGWCKSAGTILSLAADRIIMSQFGELGPIDVQLQKDDEIGERTSGLTPHQSLETLAVESGSHFQRFFRQLRFNSELGFSTKLSADIAAQMAVGLMSPIYGQLDPSRLGEVERHVRVASEYGGRLKTTNVKQNTVAKLVAAYPSHDFVIDRAEARQLFVNIERPSDALEGLAENLEGIKSKVISDRKSMVTCLNREEKTDDNDGERRDEQSNEKVEKSSGGNRKGKKSGNRQVRPSSDKTDSPIKADN